MLAMKYLLYDKPAWPSPELLSREGFRKSALNRQEKSFRNEFGRKVTFPDSPRARGEQTARLGTIPLFSLFLGVVPSAVQPGMYQFDSIAGTELEIVADYRHFAQRCKSQAIVMNELAESEVAGCR
jgi:hypothetical protein